MKPLSILRLLTVPLLLAAVSAEAATRPNVIVVMTDDQGWGDLSIHGNTTIDTPNIDRLAEEGLQFSHFYVQPVCSPTRAEFLTGRYHPRSGVFDTGGGGERANYEEESIADVFNAAGYDTAAFGKWHSGSQYPYHPMGRGFNEFYGFTSGHWGLYFDPIIEHNGAMKRAQGYIPDDFTDQAMQFIEKSAERDDPFFIFLAFNTPHSPMQVPDSYWEKYENREIEQSGTIPGREDPLHTKAALAMCENIDWNMGRLMAKLEEAGVDENTMVLYMTDNGQKGNRFNGGMKGGKGSTDEGGVRTPMFLRWPAQVEAGKVVTQIGGVIDLLPTLADLSGIEHAPKQPLDGMSLKPLILGHPQEWQERKIVSAWKGRISVRDQRFRLDPQGKLYDIENDQGQLTDVASQFPEVVEELAAYAKDWREEMFGDATIKVEGNEDTERPFLVGHQDFGVTFLPARDAKATGTIERSNRWPNDSYFLNWTSEEDQIVWNVEVLESGLYAAEIWYACPAEDIGSTIQLEFKGESASSVVKEAHDPRLFGPEINRSKLIESPVKIFRKMGLGSIQLEAGKGTMALTAPHIPAGQAIEFRMLSLSRIR